MLYETSIQSSELKIVLRTLQLSASFSRVKIVFLRAVHHIGHKIYSLCADIVNLLCEIQ